MSKIKDHIEKQFTDNHDTITCIIQISEFAEDKENKKEELKEKEHKDGAPTNTIPKSGAASKAPATDISMVQFLTGSREGNITLWNYSKVNIEIHFKAHEGQINHLIFLKKYEPDWFASCGDDGFIYLYDIHKKDKKIKTLSGHTAAVVKLCYLDSLSEEIIASLSHDGTIKIWNFVTENAFRTIDNKSIGKELPSTLIFLENFSPPTLMCDNGKNVLSYQLK